jgi:hypothetical protein
MTLHDKQLTVQPARQPPTVFWRKQLVHRRIALEIQWRQLFPRHSFSDLRLIRSPIAAPPGWDEGWSQAAREYHEERQRNQRDG